MGAFNTVIAEAVCPSCGKPANFEIQFKYGDTWQHSYSIGDPLRWGGNDIGTPGRKKVKVESIGGPCPHCRVDGIEFDVMIENDIIDRVVPVGTDREESPEEGYVILE